MSKLRIVFAGTPAFAAAHLSALLSSKHEILGIYTQPDRPTGRGKKLLPSPVKALAIANDLPCYQPASLRNKDEQDRLTRLGADLLVVVAYGLILPKEILAIPKFGCINVHASLLPRWRGAAPIERALLAGDKVSGVTIMQMDEGLDTGDMLLKSEIKIEASDNRNDVEAKLTKCGQAAIVKALDELEELLKCPEKQTETEACYAAKLEKTEALINWQKSANLINRQVRVGIGRFPAYTFLENQRIRIIEAEAVDGSFQAPAGFIVESVNDFFIVQCEDSLLKVTQVQLPGKNAMTVRDILNSKPDFFAKGIQFSSNPAAH